MVTKDHRFITNPKTLSLNLGERIPYLLICSYFYFWADEDLEELMKDTQVDLINMVHEHE